MITQAFKRWLQKLFGWFTGKPPIEAEYAHVVSSVNKNATQGSATQSTDIGKAQPGVSPRAVGQSEVNRSTSDEWPERVIPPGPNATITEKTESPPSLPSSPTTPPVEARVNAQEKPANTSEIAFPDAPLPTPTPEQQLEFLHYLVRRGIVNEGFAEGQVPEQYKKS